MSSQARMSRLCAGCLSPSAAGTSCEICGWSDAQYPEVQNHLPRHYVLLDRYYLGRVLGQGGFGVTYLAHDLKLNRPAAVKEYLPQDWCSRLTDRISIQPVPGVRSEQYAYGLTRFLEEAQSLARFVEHPCIVPV